MSTTIAVSLPPDEFAALDAVRRDQGGTREDAIRDALAWYLRWGDRLPIEDLSADESDF